MESNGDQREPMRDHNCCFKYLKMVGVSMASALGSPQLVIMSFCFSGVRIANTY